LKGGETDYFPTRSATGTMMRTTMKSKLIFAIIIVALIFGGYWIINGPKKEVINKI
jgi:hypothetical protein